MTLLVINKKSNSFGTVLSMIMEIRKETIIKGKYKKLRKNKIFFTINSEEIAREFIREMADRPYLLFTNLYGREQAKEIIHDYMIGNNTYHDDLLKKFLVLAEKNSLRLIGSWLDVIKDRKKDFKIFGVTIKEDS